MQKATVRLKKGEGRYLKSGGAWIFDNEIDAVSGSFENGDLVRVLDFDGWPLGTGCINMNSKIRVRMLTRNAEEAIDDTFFEKRLRRAWEYRKMVVPADACRLVFGEADFLPGITIDKYADVLVIESLSLGMDRYKEKILSILSNILAEDGIKIRGIYERSDAKEREKEGMQRTKGFLSEPFDTKVRITENGVAYEVDVENGQKTGFFLDQKFNRLAVQRFAKDKDVLDCFTHTGSFALNAARAGAKSVTAVDSSAFALSQAERNAALNDISNISFVCADILEYLPSEAAKGPAYDLVILDPPAFAKSKEHVKKAEKGYRAVNRDGMRLVRDGGILATCSCSHFMTRDLFSEMIAQSAKEAHVRLRLIEMRAQAPDHPRLLGLMESEYLKFDLYQVLRS